MPCPSCHDFEPRYTGGIQDQHRGMSLSNANRDCQVCSLVRSSLLYFGQKENWPDFSLSENITVTWATTGLPVSIQYNDGAGYPLVVELFTLSSLPDPWTVLKPVSLIGSTSSSPECFQQLRAWINECDTNHQDCKFSFDTALLPTRVVDLNPTKDGLRPFLLESKGMTGRYAALSYMWGTELPLRTTKATFETFKSHIPWALIPKTLQDAMLIANGLELRYVWIDALTIIQDDSDDWEAEAVKMASVYGNAYFTIGATNSTSCHDGIFKPRDESAHNVLVGPLGAGEEPRPVDSLREGEIYARRRWYNRANELPLAKRGWTFQEYLLSRRFIHYAPNELIWECRAGQAVESTPDILKKPASRLNEPLQLLALPPRNVADEVAVRELSELWTDLVQNYCQRSITVQSDKLPAMSGLANAFEASGMGRYCAGMWESDLLAELMWFCNPFDAAPPRISGAPAKPEHSRSDRAPSWSWASMEGSVDWFEISNIHGSSATPLSHLVKVSGTEMVLRGKAAHGIWERNSTWVLKPAPKLMDDRYFQDTYTLTDCIVTTGKDQINFLPDVVDTSNLHPDTGPPPGLDETPLPVVCLGLFMQTWSLDLNDTTPRYMQGLVLAPSGEGGGTYRRVGVFLDMTAMNFEGAEEVEMRIV